MMLFVPRPEAFADARADRVCRDYLSSKGYILFFCSYVGLLQWIFSIVYDRGLFEKWQLVVLFQQNNNKSKLPLLLIIFLFQSLSMLFSCFKLKSVCIKTMFIFFGYLLLQAPFPGVLCGFRVLRVSGIRLFGLSRTGVEPSWF